MRRPCWQGRWAYCHRPAWAHAEPGTASLASTNQFTGPRPILPGRARPIPWRRFSAPRSCCGFRWVWKWRPQQSSALLRRSLKQAIARQTSPLPRKCLSPRKRWEKRWRSRSWHHKCLAALSVRHRWRGESPLLTNQRNNTTGFYDALHEFRQRLGLEDTRMGEITNHSSSGIDLDLIAILQRRCLRRDQHWQANVDGVAIKNAGKRYSNDCCQTARLQGYRRVFARGAAAEIAPGHQYITRRDTTSKIRPVFAETAFCQFRAVSGHIIAARNNLIGIDVISQAPDSCHRDTPFLSGVYCVHPTKCWRGSVMTPVIAEAAIVAGLPR